MIPQLGLVLPVEWLVTEPSKGKWAILVEQAQTHRALHRRSFERRAANDGIHAALDRVVAFVGRLVAKIPARFRPVFLDSIVEAGEAAQARIAERTAKAVAPAAALGPGVVVAAALPTGGALPGVALGAAAAGAALPAVSELCAVSERRDSS